MDNVLNCSIVKLALEVSMPKDIEESVEFRDMSSKVPSSKILFKNPYKKVQKLNYGYLVP